MWKEIGGGSQKYQKSIKIFAFLCIFLAVLFLVAGITGCFPCITNITGIATAFATIAGSILVFSTLEMQRKALNEERHKNEVERFDSRFYPILSSFRTDASNMNIAGDYISPKGIGVKSSYVGENAFVAARSMANSLKRCLNDRTFKEFDRDEFDAIIDNYYQIFEIGRAHV